MKRLIFLGVIGMLLITSCTPEKKANVFGNSISGVIEGAGGQTIILQRFIKNRPVATDSVKIDSDGEFRISPSFTMPLDYYGLMLRESNTFLIMITDSSEDVEIKTSVENFERGTQFDGSPNSAYLQDFYREMKSFEKNTSELEEKIMQAKIAGESGEEFKGLAKTFTREKRNYCTKFIRDKSPSPAILAALTELNINVDLPIFEKAYSQLANNFGHSYYYEMVGNRIADLKANQARIQQKQDAQVTQQAAASGKPAVGTKAPELKFADPKGKERSLSDLKGKYVLIDFWASWCGPCRRENPSVVGLYNKYKSKGFEIFSVSLDKDQTKWIQAIQQDQLSWPNHVSDLKGWSSDAARLYGVQSIPHTVLLDKEGTIIASGLRGPNLTAKLAELMGS